jgi:hypothetical protein
MRGCGTQALRVARPTVLMMFCVFAMVVSFFVFWDCTGQVCLSLPCACTCLMHIHCCVFVCLYIAAVNVMLPRAAVWHVLCCAVLCHDRASRSGVHRSGVGRVVLQAQHTYSSC